LEVIGTDNFIKVAHPTVGEEEVEAVKDVILSGNYVSGEKVEAFERAFAQYIGTKHAIAVDNGTSALHIALETVGVGEGDEVIVPPLTFFSTISSVLYHRAIPIFADIDLDDLCLSPEDTKRKITKKTKAIIPVHLFGNVAKIDAFMKTSNENNIPIIEDCAQAHGSEYGGKKVGRFGRAGCFSFFATKHMTTGEGGMITTNDDEISRNARIIRNHGMNGRDDHTVLGFNHRMNEIEAALGLVQLGRLDELNTKRIRNSEFLLKVLKKLPWARTPVIDKRIKHSYFWIPLIIDRNRTKKTFEDLKNHLQSNRVGFRHRYKEPLYKQDVLKNIGLDYSNVYLPNAEEITGKVLGLPNHPGLTQNELDRIVEVLGSF